MDALRQARGDREAAAAIILDQFEAPEPVEAEVLSWSDPIEATLVDEPGPAKPKKSLARRISSKAAKLRRGRAARSRSDPQSEDSGALELSDDTSTV